MWQPATVDNGITEYEQILLRSDYRQILWGKSSSLANVNTLSKFQVFENSVSLVFIFKWSWNESTIFTCQEFSDLYRTNIFLYCKWRLLTQHIQESVTRSFSWFLGQAWGWSYTHMNFSQITHAAPPPATVSKWTYLTCNCLTQSATNGPPNLTSHKVGLNINMYIENWNSDVPFEFVYFTLYHDLPSNVYVAKRKWGNRHVYFAKGHVRTWEMLQ